MLVIGSAIVLPWQDLGKYIVYPRLVDGVHLATVYQLHMCPGKMFSFGNRCVTSTLQLVSIRVHVGHNYDDPKVANFLVA